MTKIKLPKKLIEVALPLDDINLASSREKSIRHGHPSTLHLWWARRPLAAARAVLFAQMVNDPGYQRDIGFGVNKHEAEKKREYLFDIIRDLVKWENSNNVEVLKRAKDAIWESWRETCELNKKHPDAKSLFDPSKLPAAHDPFSGGGTIPLEAQRLGLDSYATDLNPVAVMLNRAMIEVPPKFADMPPVCSEDYANKQFKLKHDWNAAQGLAEDVRRYGKWVKDKAFQKIGHLYPQVTITEEMVLERPDLAPILGEELTVNACLWARTVKSPNPVFDDIDVPLISNFVLSSKKGREVYIEPVVAGNSYELKIVVGTPPKGATSGTKLGRGGNFKCVLSEVPIPVKEIREQGKAGKMGKTLMAVVAESSLGRVFLTPNEDMLNLIESNEPSWSPSFDINHNPRDIRTQLYGLTQYGDLFTKRQLIALNTFSELIHEARKDAIERAVKSGLIDDGKSLKQGGESATAYGDAIAIYLALALGRASDYWTSLATWENKGEFVAHAFTKQAIPMVWDFADSNPFSNASGNWEQTCVSWVARVIDNLPAQGVGIARQADAQTQDVSVDKVISTDPPYYDNIAYADLADYFYVWMRKTLRDIDPDLFATISVPKSDELVASSHRHGGKSEAEEFFMNGMSMAIERVQSQCHPAFPVSIYYAFKQSETKDDSTSNTGWETFLESVIQSGFSIDGTWPLRTERTVRTVAIKANALASSILLVCRKRSASENDDSMISRRQFQRELKADMPEALEAMIGGESGQSPIAPVDLAQAAIGPGMAIYSKYDAVLNQDGSKMSVHDALIMINKEITDYLNPDAGSYDADTLFCSDWFDQYGWSQGEFGIADTLARAKGTSVEGVHEAGVIEAGAGKVRLLRWEDMDSDWDPKSDNRVPVWEACHQIIRELNQKGESAAGALLARMPEHGEAIRQLAYHMYTLCERKKWAEDARAYNELITAWHSVVEASLETGHKNEQMGFDL